MVNSRRNVGPIVLCLVVILGMVVGPAQVGAAPLGAEPSDADRAAARALFEQGRELMEAGDFEQARGKLDASRGIVNGVGILYHLAECQVRTGRTASAWALYREVASRSAAAGQSARQAEAIDRAEALEAELSTLRIDPPGDASELVVVRNGQPVPLELLGVAMPVDPGHHLIEASGSGDTDFVQHVSVEPDRDEVVVQILLTSAEQPSPPPAPSVHSPRAAGLPPDLMVSRNEGYEYLEPVGWVVTGSGLVATAVGFGIFSAGESKVKASEDRCAGDLAGCADAEAVEQAQQGSALKRTGLPLGIAGLTGLVAGVVTLIAYGQASAGVDGADVAVVAGSDGVGATLSLSF